MLPLGVKRVRVRGTSKSKSKGSFFLVRAKGMVFFFDQVRVKGMVRGKKRLRKGVRCKKAM